MPPRRVATVARAAQVLIVLYGTVLSVHVGLIVSVARRAVKRREIAGRRMALRTVAPAVIVCTRVDREVLRVVIPVGGHPTGGRVTVDAGGREERCGVAG